MWQSLGKTAHYECMRMHKKLQNDAILLFNRCKIQNRYSESVSNFLNIRNFISKLIQGNHITSTTCALLKLINIHGLVFYQSASMGKSALYFGVSGGTGGSGGVKLTY